MNKLFKLLSVLMVIAYLVTACIPPVVDVARAAPEEVSYRAVLGKPASDQSVAEFIASNDCAPSSSFRLCDNAGLADRGKHQDWQAAKFAHFMAHFHPIHSRH